MSEISAKRKEKAEREENELLESKVCPYLLQGKCDIKPCPFIHGLQYETCGLYMLIKGHDMPHMSNFIAFYSAKLFRDFNFLGLGFSLLIKIKRKSLWKVSTGSSQIYPTKIVDILILEMESVPFCVSFLSSTIQGWYTTGSLQNWSKTDQASSMGQVSFFLIIKERYSKRYLLRDIFGHSFD